MELVGPNLWHCMRLAGPEGLPIAVVRKIIHLLLGHIVFLHHRGFQAAAGDFRHILHRDISLGNVCVTVDTPLPLLDPDQIKIIGRYVCAVAMYLMMREGGRW